MSIIFAGGKSKSRTNRITSAKHILPGTDANKKLNKNRKVIICSRCRFKSSLPGDESTQGRNILCARCKKGIMQDFMPTKKLTKKKKRKKNKNLRGVRTYSIDKLQEH